MYFCKIYFQDTKDKTPLNHDVVFPTPRFEHVCAAPGGPPIVAPGALLQPFVPLFAKFDSSRPTKCAASPLCSAAPCSHLHLCRFLYAPCSTHRTVQPALVTDPRSVQGYGQSTAINDFLHFLVNQQFWVVHIK